MKKLIKIAVLCLHFYGQTTIAMNEQEAEQLKAAVIDWRQQLPQEIKERIDLRALQQRIAQCPDNLRQELLDICQQQAMNRYAVYCENKNIPVRQSDYVMQPDGKLQRRSGKRKHIEDTEQSSKFTNRHK